MVSTKCEVVVNVPINGQSNSWRGFSLPVTLIHWPCPLKNDDDDHHMFISHSYEIWKVLCQNLI